MKKILSLLCVLSLFLTCSASVFAEESPEDALYNELFGDCTFIDGLTELEQLALVQRDAVKADELLLASGILATEDGEIPDWYGGRYISDDNVLKIKIVGDHPEIESAIEEMMTADADYAFETASISLNELNALADAVSEAVEGKEIVSISISQTHSTVTLTVPEQTNLSKSAAAKRVLGDSLYRQMTTTPHLVVETGPRAELTAALRGGDIIYTRNASGTALNDFGTIGYCGNYGSINCILTAGHVLDGLTEENGAKRIYYGNNGANYVVLNPGNHYINFYDGAYGDYGVVAIGSQNTRTNLVKLSSTTVGPIDGVHSFPTFTTGNMGLDPNAPVEGRIVFKYGYVTGMTTGRIQGDADSITYGNISIEGLMTVRKLDPEDPDLPDLSADGDSGGPVWYLNSNDERILAGVVSGGLGGNLSGTEMYFSPIYYANNVFDPYF